ncbi:hypothetical protein CF326_g2345 [Tilletia indica]|nr:hypothetical protein CF326_g2345 [Tilletia indica]
MTRGRRPNLELPVTPSLNAQRAFRERKRKHLTDLEESVQRLTQENEDLKRRLLGSTSASASASTSATTASRSVDASTQTDPQPASPERPCRSCSAWSEAYSNVSSNLDRLRLQLTGLAQDQSHAPSPLQPRPSSDVEHGSNGKSFAYTPSPDFVTPIQPLALSHPLSAASPKRPVLHSESPHLMHHKRQRTSESSSSASPQYSTFLEPPPQASRMMLPQASLPFPSSNWWTGNRPSPSSSRPLGGGSGAAHSSNRSSIASTANEGSIASSPTVADPQSNASATTSPSTGTCCVEEAALAKGASPTTAASQGCGGSLRRLCNIVSASAAEHRSKAEHARSQSLSTASGPALPTTEQSYAESRRWSSTQGMSPHQSAPMQFQLTVPRQLSLPSLAETLGTDGNNNNSRSTSHLSTTYQSLHTGSTSYLPVHQRSKSSSASSSSSSPMPAAAAAAATAASSEIGAANAIRAMSRGLAVDLDPQRPDSRQQPQQQQQQQQQQQHPQQQSQQGGGSETVSASFWPSAPAPAGTTSKKSCSKPSGGCGPQSSNATGGSSSACGNGGASTTATATATSTDDGRPNKAPSLPELDDERCCYGLVECDDQGRVIF